MLRHPITAAMRARARAGGWQQLMAASPFKNGANTEMLMTDGSVVVQDYCASDWYRLTPDKNGSYINGRWSAIAPMPSTYGPLYYASAVLPDGKLIVQGGEYNFCSQDETSLGAIYDPVANTWTSVTGPSGWSEIGDAQSVVLSNGTYMLGNCCYSTQAQLNEATMTWTIISSGKHDTNSEEGWTLLRTGELLAADVFGQPASELFNPTTSTWSSAGNLPQNLTASFEIGPQTLRPNNTVFAAGADQYTAIYNAKTAKWTQGPNFPIIGGQQYDMADAPASVLTDGTVLVATGPGVYNPPTQFLTFNGKSFKQIANTPDASQIRDYNVRLLLLPNGQVLETDGSNDVEVYDGKNRIDNRIAPAITSVPTTLASGSTYTVAGRRFNGATQANFYGDDNQQATNYPLVRIANMTTGHVFYARTHNHSYMGVGSNRKVTTMFDVPAGIEKGASSLYVVVNGIASPPVSVTIN